MTLPLTPAVLRAAYDYLATTPPFDKWNLPDGDDVTFRVARDPQLFGWCDRKRGRWLIAISETTVGHTATLLETMAHEIVHMHEDGTGAGRGKGQHSAAFKKWAAQVSQIHGFDPKRF